MEENCTPLQAAATFAACEALWANPQARQTIDMLFDEAYQTFRPKVVVLDDDPTGVQTVHDVPVVTNWELPTLLAEFQRPEPMFFVLTNSRSFSAEKTKQVHQEIARNVVAASRQTGREYLLVCRGDSTLRGHMPVEEQAMAETLASLEEPCFDGEILCPFFREGGRYTYQGVHYVQEGDHLTPAAQT